MKYFGRRRRRSLLEKATRLRPDESGLPALSFGLRRDKSPWQGRRSKVQGPKSRQRGMRNGKGNGPRRDPFASLRVTERSGGPKSKVQGPKFLREGQALALQRRWGGCGSGKFTLTLPSPVKGEGKQCSLSPPWERDGVRGHAFASESVAPRQRTEARPVRFAQSL